MRLKTYLPMYVFTSQIPTLDFAEVGIDPVSVTVWAGRDKLLETTMYPVYGHIRLYDLGDLYEEYLRSQDGEDIYPYTILEIDIDNHVWEDNMIIYCPYHCNLTALEFINKHFLTTLSTKRVPADASREDEILPYLLTSEEVAARNNSSSMKRRKRRADYRFRSRLLSARQVQNGFILIAATAVKHVREVCGG